MDACPPLEEIAAFLDGTLSPEDRERITAHLASCESCYEIFAGAVRFQEEDDPAVDTKGDVVPFPFADETDRTGVSVPPVAAPDKVRPRASRWLALAASVLLAAVGFFAWRAFVSPPQVAQVALSEVVKQVEGKTGVAEHVYLNEDIYRSGGAPEDISWNRPTFLTGVHLLDLRLSLQAGGDADKTDRLIQDLGNVLQEVPGMTDIGESYLESRQGQLDPKALLRQEEVVQRVLAESPAFQFGLWTEAGRLAALTRSPKFFDDQNNRQFLDHLSTLAPWDDEELAKEASNELQAIQETWDAGELTEEEYDLLAKHFERLIEAYDTSDDL